MLSLYTNTPLENTRCVHQKNSHLRGILARWMTGVSCPEMPERLHTRRHTTNQGKKLPATRHTEITTLIKRLHAKQSITKTTKTILSNGVPLGRLTTQTRSPPCTKRTKKTRRANSRICLGKVRKLTRDTTSCSVQLHCSVRHL